MAEEIREVLNLLNAKLAGLFPYRLELVNPKSFPDEEATALAAGADDVLDKAVIHRELREAVRDCVPVFGTSARQRNISWPVLTPAQAARQVAGFYNASAQIAIVFGRESSGLTNEELELCSNMISIPSNPSFSSLKTA